MALPLKPFASLVSDAAAYAQSQAVNLLGFATGSVELAIVQATATVGVWLQYVAMVILATTRLATSAGTDVDSFIEDFGMTRLPGVAATGDVEFTTFTPSDTSATVPVGTLVKTVSGTVYAVVQDSNNPNWSVTAGGYLRDAGVASITVPVQAQVAGSSGNVLMGAICLMGSAVAGIDTVTNTAAFTNGSDTETDAEVKTRFPLWLSAKATANAASVGEAIAEVQNGLTYELLDGETPDGAACSGYFTAVVDDGSGDAPDSLLTSVGNAINTAKALGVQYAVQRPTDLVLNVGMTVYVPVGTATGTVSDSIGTAIAADIRDRPVGTGYPYSRLIVVAYNTAAASISSIVNATINGATADIPATDRTVVRPGNIQITVVVVS